MNETQLFIYHEIMVMRGNGQPQPCILLDAVPPQYNQHIAALANRQGHTVRPHDNKTIIHCPKQTFEAFLVALQADDKDQLRTFGLFGG